MNRREIFGAAVAATAVAAGTGALAQAAAPHKKAAAHKGGGAVDAPPHFPGGMRIALSGITTEGKRTPSTIANDLTMPQFLELAKTIGYDGVHLRASLAGAQMPLDDLTNMAKEIKASGLGISSVCPDFKVPINGPNAADCLHNIEPFLTFAEIFGNNLIRVGVKSEADIPLAQRCADQARERNLRLVHHAEARTMFATYELSMHTLKAINRPNFGIQQDESQWMCNTKDYDPKGMLERLKNIQPWNWEVFIKNQPGGPGPENRPELRLDDKSGVEFDRLFDALHTIGYKGYIQVHSHKDAYGTAQAAAEGCYKFLKPYLKA